MKQKEWFILKHYLQYKYLTTYTESHDLKKTTDWNSLNKQILQNNQCYRYRHLNVKTGEQTCITHKILRSFILLTLTVLINIYITILYKHPVVVWTRETQYRMYQAIKFKTVRPCL